MLLWLVIGIPVLIILWLIATYNGLISLKNRTDEAWSDIDVQTKRRYDLIPNLVEAVKGYAKHEKQVFTDVTKARTEAMKAGTIHDKAAKENMLTDALKSVFAVAENYPELKASDNFLQLQGELTDTEDKIEAARRFYNGNVRDFNTKLQVFPTNMFAQSLGFTAREFFEATGAEKAPVTVDFSEK
ncbi:LemA family protein [Candidatus Berkelbacteria bacterium]|nr:LemA family protein [Candidatus Berkelbacteria bacterium]